MHLQYLVKRDAMREMYENPPGTFFNIEVTISCSPVQADLTRLRKNSDSDLEFCFLSIFLSLSHAYNMLAHHEAPLKPTHWSLCSFKVYFS